MKVDFRSKQKEFASYIKDPFNNPQPADVKRQRMETYRELFFNNVDSFLSSNFPVIKTLLDDEKWFELAQDFYSNHNCTTPYFSEIPEEFIGFLQSERCNDTDYPFLLELAHYEWVEMALSISKEQVAENTSEFIQHLEEEIIDLSAVAWPLVYQFPVHQISPIYLPELIPDKPTYLLVYRDIADEVNFIQISPITFRLLQLLLNNEGISCKECLDQLAQESAYPEPETIMTSGLQLIQDFATKNIVIPKNKEKMVLTMGSTLQL